MSRVPRMMSELIEALPSGITLVEVAIKCRGWGKDIEWRISVLETEHANYSVGRAVAGQIRSAFDRTVPVLHRLADERETP